MTTDTAPVRVEDVVGNLRRVYATGRTRGIQWRLRQLDGIGRLVTERETEIAAALEADLGRSAVEAWLGDLTSTKGEGRLREEESPSMDAAETATDTAQSAAGICVGAV